MDKQLERDLASTLKIFGVKEKDCEGCIADLMDDFNAYRRRMRRQEEERREIEAKLRE